MISPLLAQAAVITVLNQSSLPTQNGHYIAPGTLKFSLYSLHWHPLPSFIFLRVFTFIFYIILKTYELQVSNTSLKTYNLPLRESHVATIYVTC